MCQNDDASLPVDRCFACRRRAYRATVRGLQLRVEDDDRLYNVCDISGAGCGLCAPPGTYTYEVGRILSVRLEAGGKILLPGLRAKVVRSLPDCMVACSFQELTQRQEYALDKLVLEIQKRQIDLMREQKNRASRE